MAYMVSDFDAMQRRIRKVFEKERIVLEKS